jgi:hypothetical protein
MAKTPRSASARLADTIARLEARDADTWVATASPLGAPHMIPLSFAWHGERILLATPASTLTIRNLEATRRARLGFGDSRDVVLMDVELEFVVEAGRAPADLAEAYLRQAGWDPRASNSGYSIVALRPVRILAWNGEHEWEGRILMEGGAWRA